MAETTHSNAWLGFRAAIRKWTAAIRAFLRTRNGEASDHLAEATEDDVGALSQMRQDWELRAKENARYYIATKAWKTEEEFDSSGRDSLAYILHDIEEYLTPGMTALEIGCGAGRLLKPLAARFRHVTGVDISPEMVRIARARLAAIPNASLIVNDGATLTAVPDQSIDVAISFIVFQHIPDKSVIGRYAEEAYRVLRPGGFFKFQVCGRLDSPGSEQEEARRVKDTWMGVRFTRTEAGGLAEDAGLDVLDVYFETDPDGAERIQYLWVVSQRPPA
jgi:SAM-dependent methyltransferase